MYDAILVGAGTAGCVLAGRLVEAGWQVAVIEAGPRDRSPLIHNPQCGQQALREGLRWSYETEPQPCMVGRRRGLDRARVVGGCSSINSLVYVRGHAAEYDHWAVPGWSYAELVPAFEAVEARLQPRLPDHLSAVATAFCHGAVELGLLGPEWNFNTGQLAGGAGPYALTLTPDGQRNSAARAFLLPVEHRPGLRLICDSPVEKILVDKGRVVGVQCRHPDEGLRTFRADRVVLCAGAIGTPQLLMLSGIGPADALRKLGLQVEVDSPEVGQNLQDHLAVPCIYELQHPTSHPSVLPESGLFLGGDESSPFPSLQFHVHGAAPWQKPDLPLDTGRCMVQGILTRPQSRGRLWLTSAHPQSPPALDPAYLSAAHDRDLLVAAVEWCRACAATRAWGASLSQEAFPLTNGAQLLEIVAAWTDPMGHLACTARMGTDSRSVVDPHLRVRGVEGLWAADASILPEMISGNLQALCFAIGYKAADLMLAEKAVGRPE